MKKHRVLASAAAALVLPIANAADPPELKEGLWSIRTQSIYSPGNDKNDSTLTLCRNHASDKLADGQTKSVKKDCTKDIESFQGGKLTIDMHCVVAGSVVDTKGTATYTADTSVHAENHSTYSPALGGVSESTTIMDQKYLGSCPAGAKPGEMIRPKP